MQGSEKQIKWAEDIKAAWLAKWEHSLLSQDKYCEHYDEQVGLHEVVVSGVSHMIPTEIIDHVRLIGEGALAMEALTEAAALHEDAKFWIDNRDNINSALTVEYDALIKAKLAR